MSSKSNVLEHLTDDELDDKIDKVHRSCQSWRGCKDGSYEMALFNRGYDDLIDERSKREKM